MESRIERLERAITISGLDTKQSKLQASIKSGDIESQIGLSDNFSILMINEKGDSSYIGTHEESGLSCAGDTKYSKDLIFSRLFFWILSVFASGPPMDCQKDELGQFRTVIITNDRPLPS